MLYALTKILTLPASGRHYRVRSIF